MALRELLAYFRIDVQTGKLDVAHKKLNATKASTVGLFDSLGGLQQAFVGLGAALGVQQIVSWTRATLEAADASVKIASSVGVTSEEFQAFQTLGDTVGVNMAAGLKTLAKVAEADAGAFGELGIKVKAANGSLLPTAEIADAALVALAGMSNETARVALATQLFGDQGNQLIPLLKGGSEALRDQMQMARRLGVAFDQDLGESAGKFLDLMTLLKVQSMAVRGTILKFLLPTMTSLVRWLTEGTASVNEWVKSGQAMTKISAALTMGFGGLVSHFGGIGGIIQKITPLVNRLFFAFLRFAYPFLLIEDFFTFLRGGDSVIGRLLESLGLVDNASKAGKALGQAFKDMLPAVLSVASAVGRFFGEAYAGSILLGAMLVGAFTGANGEIERDFRDKFASNTNTIGAFFDAIGAKLSWLTGAWSAIWAGLNSIVTEYVSDLLGAFQRFGDGMTSAVIAAVAGITVSLAELAQAFDFAFGTQLTGVVWAASGAIIQAFNAAWSGASAGISGLIAWVEDAGLKIKKLITDPIAALADTLDGVTDSEMRKRIDAINAENRAAAAARGAAAGRSVVIEDKRTTNVSVGPSATPAATGRAVGEAVAATQGNDRRRTLAAVQ